MTILTPTSGGTLYDNLGRSWQLGSTGGVLTNGSGNGIRDGFTELTLDTATDGTTAEYWGLGRDDGSWYNCDVATLGWTSTTNTPPSVLDQTTGLSVSVSGLTATVTWDAITGATSYAVGLNFNEHGFEVYATPTTNSLTINNLSEGSNGFYDIMIAATNDSGTGPYCEPVRFSGS